MPRVIAILICFLLPIAALAEGPSFKNEIAPILVEHCVGCHGPKKAGGGWRADTFARLAEEGDSVSPGFGNSLDESEAWRRIVSDDAKERMPLDDDPLSAEQQAKIAAWLKAGKPFDGPDPQAPLLSYVPPVVHPPPPEVYPAAIPVTALAFSPDGEELYSSGYHEVLVWESSSGKLLRRIKNLPQRIYRIAVSPDGSLLAIAGGNAGRLGEVRLINRESGELVRVLGVSFDVVFAAAFHPSGERLATGAADGLVRVFEVATGKEVLSLGSHSDWVFDLAWNADGTRLASASRDKTAKVFDAEKGKLLFSFSEHEAAVHGVAMDRAGKHVVSAGEDDRVFRWRIEDGKRERELKLDGDGGVVLRAGENLLTTGNENKVRLVSRELRPIRTFEGLPDWATAAAFDAQHERIAAGAFDGMIVVQDASNEKVIAKLRAAPGLK